MMYHIQMLLALVLFFPHSSCRPSKYLFSSLAHNLTDYKLGPAESSQSTENEDSSSSSVLIVILVILGFIIAICAACICCCLTNPEFLDCFSVCLLCCCCCCGICTDRDNQHPHHHYQPDSQSFDTSRTPSPRSHSRLAPTPPSPYLGDLDFSQELPEYPQLNEVQPPASPVHPPLPPPYTLPPSSVLQSDGLDSNIPNESPPVPPVIETVSPSAPPQ